MRVTNKMMSTGMLNNIMSNKADMNTKFNQYATGQKIQKPSEDPVVAIRSLKYRANLTQVTQYLKKNVEDAYNWMEVTESALNSMTSLLTDITEYVVQGSNDTYEVIDRDSISSQLQQYKEELYGMLNTDNAGRYVFSGYRTDTTVTYLSEDSSKKYTITEPLTFENMYEKQYVTGCASYEAGKDAEYYASNFAPTNASVYCLNLGYKDLDKEELTFTYVAADGTANTLTLNPCQSSDTDVYDFTDTDGVKFIADTGQIIFSQDMYDTLRTAKSITTEYQKSEFEVGDVRPEMYYDCTAVGIVKNPDGTVTEIGDTINYSRPEEQDIKYNISTSQSLKVNTLANQTLNSSYARALDNIMEAVDNAYDTQSKIEDVDLLLANSNLTDEEKEAYTKLREQLDTELSIRKSIIRDTFSSAITATQNAQSGNKVAYQDGTVKKISIGTAQTDLGSRYSRLQMIETRLEEQSDSITELLDNNEQVNMEEAIVNYQDAYITYIASLTATGKVAQNTLLDFL